MNDSSAPYHVPDVVGQPVGNRVTAADKLQMFSLRGLLSHQKDNKAGRHKGHGHDDEDGNHHVCALQSGEAYRDSVRNGRWRK